MGLFLYIDIDAFFASVEQSLNRRLQGRPVMVGGLKHERGVVACPSYEARARGVRTGTALHEAAQLIPDGVFLKGDYHQYQHYSDRFYDILSSITPDIDRVSQDEACLDITGAVRRFGSPRSLAAELQSSIYEKLALSTSIGIGPSRVVAKIASEYRKPLGLTIVENDSLRDFMAAIPIKRLPGVGSVTGRILREMGIETAGQLAQVPEMYLKRIFGINGLKIAAYSRGEDGTPFRNYKAVRTVSRETGFAEDITDKKILLSHFYYLLERAGAKLRRLNRKAATVRIKFRYADFETIEGTSPLSPPSHDETAIFPRVEMMFERLFCRRLGIRLVGVTLANLKGYADNETLIKDRSERSRELLRGLDAARGKNGFFSLMTGRTLALAELYQRGDTGYVLRTPGLSQ